MELNYDEDLNENPFFQILQSEQPELFQQATLEGWVICVPRAGSLPKYTLTDEDFYSHILIPSDELPESHFRTLGDKEVRVCNRVISVENDVSNRPYTSQILFEETFYTDDLFKYKVLCVETPLEPQSCSNHASDLGLVTLQSLRDCIDLLWTESSGKEVMEQLDQSIRGFLETQPDLENESLQTQIDLINGLYLHCVQIALKDQKIKEKTSMNKHLLFNIKLAVETYIQHGIYKNMIKGITAITATEDAQLNKTIRNSSELQLRDLEVRNDLFDTIPSAKQELAHIDGYSTVLGKVGCIRRAMTSISGEQVVCADDFLPVLIFLVIKVSLPNWIAHLTMMKQFRFSTKDEDESSFLVTSLEAALEHIKSGCLFGPMCPESQLEENETMNYKLSFDKSKENTLEYFLNLIKYGNVDEIKNILDTNIEQLTPTLENAGSLCHPLCSCDKCEGELSKLRHNITPTLQSRDDKGMTPLHIACKYGKLLIVELFLERGSRINSKDMRGCTPLHHAAAGGHQNALLLLLHSNALPDIPDNDTNTPLHFASNNGHEACVKALLYFSEHLGQPVNVDAKNVNGDTPLHHASRWGYQGIVQILLEYGASADVKNNRKKSPMDCAHSIHISRLLSTLVRTPAKRGLKKTVSFLKIKVAAASKSRLDFSDSASNTSMSSNGIPSPSRSNEGNYEYGVRPRSATQNKKIEKLLKAITVGDIRLACYYIGLEGNESREVAPATAKQPCHPLCMCESCIKNNSQQTAIETPPTPSADDEPLMPNACNPEGTTALHAAAMYGRSELVPLLICAGSKVNIRTTGRGATPLHLACQNKRTSTASALLDVPGCDINAQDSMGNTPLHYACLSGSAPLVQLLLKFSPNLQLRNVQGKTPLVEAEDRMALRMVQLLRGQLLSSN